MCFGNEPLLRVEAPLIQAQLIETILLNIVNFHTLITTKASRIRQVAPQDTLMEFGTRRAQEIDAAVWGARAAYIGGFDSTSNVRAGKLFGIPVSGTHAHALFKHMVMSIKHLRFMQNDIKIVCFSRYVPHFKIRGTNCN